MIQQDLAKSIFKSLDNFGLILLAENYKFKFNDTIKLFVLDSIETYPPDIETSNKIKIEVRKEEFMLSLLTDFYFGFVRIQEQIKNVDNLLKSESQVSWIITTTYYACYFMAVELAKLNGQFIMNFSKDDFEKILRHSKNKENILFSSDINNSFKITVSHSENANFLYLSLYKDSSKPHQIVWKNLHNIISNTPVHDNIFKYKELMLNICSSNDAKWRFPSDIRNEWNYARADYYGNKGSELGKKFISIVKQYESTVRWAGNITIKPTDENVVASIAYLYHILRKTVELIDNRLKLDM